MSTWTPDTLRAARKRKGWSQPELARRLDVSDRAVSNWETGRTGIEAKHQRRLTELLVEGGELQTLSQLREAVALQTQMLRILVEQAESGTGEFAELSARLARLEFVLGEREAP